MVDGYVTQSRVIEPGSVKDDPSRYEPVVLINNGITSLTSIADLRTSQTTTSFRTNVLDTSSLKSGRDQYRFLLNQDTGKGRGDNGHTFSTEKVLKVSSYVRKYRTISGKVWGIDGYCNPFHSPASTEMALPPVPSFDENWYGNRFIADTAPTVPKANLALSLAELLRDGIASVPGTAVLQSIADRSSFFRSLGKEYLNLQFGWAPFLSDLTDMIKSVSNANQALLNLRRNSGRLTRRRRSLPPKISMLPSVTFSNKVPRAGTASGSLGSVWNPMFQGGSAGRTGIATVERRISEEIWFSGAFTYFLDPGSTLIGKFERYEQEANHLLGLRITPEVLWNLMPWSWLVDWFVDVSSALAAAELLSEDGLVMQYGYMMRKTTRSVTSSMPVTFLGDSAPTTLFLSHTAIRKERFRATPFGFGLNPNSFTARQWAILGALGLTKAPNSLF